MQKEADWHSRTIKEVFGELESSENGLTEAESERRLREYGMNVISTKRKSPAFMKFLKKFNSPLIYLLFSAMTISFIFGHVIDGYVILAVVLVNVTIGFIQERKAEKSIDALEKLIISYARVYRDGGIRKIPSSQLVPGDVIFLEEGDKIPSDARLTELKNFKTQESSLTGESVPETKKIKTLEKSVSLGDRANMVYMSTLVVSGSAKAVVVDTANRTQIGRVAKSLQEVIHPNVHFNEKVSQLTIQMATFAGIGAFLTFVIGFFIRGLEFFDIFLFTVASLVSGIPEGLPAVLVIVLSVGARRMAKRNAVIRHLPSVETLGVANVIATDKTGTLTRNSMTIEKIVTFEDEFEITGDGWKPSGEFFHGGKLIRPLKKPLLKKILEMAATCNKGDLTEKNKKHEISGDPTEVSLVVLAKKTGIDREKLKRSIETEDDFPFSSDLRLRATLVNNKETKTKELYSFGAFESVLEKSSRLQKNGGKVRLSRNAREKIMEKAEKLAEQGYRVLAIAFKKMPENAKSVSRKVIDDMTFACLVAMKDPPRKGVRDAIKKARNAGIRIIMKTGDHKSTALAIARETGLADKNTEVITEEEIRKMSDSELEEAVKKFDVYARVSPRTKLRIVTALQSNGEIVAMTGDGVNDAPSLKKADVGISMGIMGTDVAREASEIVLTDDNFASVVNAVEEGRVVFQNVRQTSFFLVTTNVAEDVTIISSLALGFPLPLLPIQLLYLNLVTDTFSGIALSMEPGHGDVLNKPPRKKEERILNKELIFFLASTAVLMVLGTLILFNNFLSQGVSKAQTIAFVSISTFQIFNVLNMRSIRRSVFRIGIFSNRWITLSITTSLLLMASVIYVPFLQEIFRFTPPELTDLLLIALVSSSVFVFGEIYKRIAFREKPRRKKPIFRR